MNTADMLTTYLSKLPNLIIALLVLLIGWGIAKIIEKAVYKGLQKTKIDDRLFAEKKPARYSSEKVISKIIYFIALIIVFILFFNIRGFAFCQHAVGDNGGCAERFKSRFDSAVGLGGRFAFQLSRQKSGHETG